jgi:myosin protein heavy chain
MLQLEREKSAHDRQLETSRKQLEAESTKRSQLEQLASRQKAELIQLRDRTTKYDRDINKILTELKNREWEVKQLESKQDKTIVEHVHVLEEAKRVTDRQLADAHKELQKNAVYIRSLEKSKTRLAGEAEDLARETERERVELRAKEKAAKAQEEKAAKAMADIIKERRAREAAELASRRLQSDLQNSQHQLVDVTQQLAAVQRSKDNLETELERLAGEADYPSSMAKMQRQYEARIGELENKLQDSNSTEVTAARLKEQVDRQHAELRRLIMDDSPKDDQFRSRLLRELQLADEELRMEMSSRSRNLPGNKTATLYTLENLTPTKNGATRTRKESQPDQARAADKQVNALKQQVQVLELRMAASERVRRHLETSIRDMTADLENSDGSKQFLQQYRIRLAKENARLAELLEEEAQARRTAEAAQMDGVQAMWNKVQQTMADERESYSRLEESRKALVSLSKGPFTGSFSHVPEAYSTTYCPSRAGRLPKPNWRAQPVKEAASNRNCRLEGSTGR